MDRTELRAIGRRVLTPEQSAMVGDIEFNSIINQGIVELSREAGGIMKETTLTTDGDGIADLPADLLRIHRLVYESTQMAQIDINDI